MGRDTAYWYRRGRGCSWAKAGSRLGLHAVMALGRGLCLLKTAVMANRTALHDDPRRHIANAVTNKGPEADAGRNSVVAHPRIGVVPAITALWVGLVGSPLPCTMG